MQKLYEKNPFLDFTDENSQSQTFKECEEKNVFDFTDENLYKRQSCRIFETSGGLFQINATNVRNRQFVEDILANTRGQSMCRGDNDPPKEGEFVI